LRRLVLLLVLAGCERADRGQPEIDYVVGLLARSQAELEASARRAAAVAALAEPPPVRERKPDVVLPLELGDAVSFGPADAPVTLVVATRAFDLRAFRLEPTIEQLRRQFPEQLRVVKMLITGQLDPSRPGNVALCAAARQSPDAFARLERRLWQEKRVPAGVAGDERLAALAGELGLDVARFRADLGGPLCQMRIDAEEARLAALGLKIPPVLLVNGRVQHNHTFDSLHAAVSAALTR
jgi:hypothetical protein